MTSLRHAGFKTSPVQKPNVVGIIRTEEQATSNTYPQPIIYHPLYFVCVCIPCGAIEVGPRRATLQAAIADRIGHQRKVHP